MEVELSDDVQLDTFDSPNEAPKKEIDEDGIKDQVDVIDGELDGVKKEKTEKKPEKKDDDTPSIEETVEKKEEKPLNHDESIVEVKVNGKSEKVSLKELKENYSGKVAYDKKFSDLGKKSKEVEKKMMMNEERVKTISSHFDQVMTLLQDDRGNPLDSLFYIIDKAGLDPVQFKKRLFSSFGGTYERFQNMDDLERELYWQKEENEFLRKHQNSERERLTQESKRRDIEEALSKHRAAHGISEETYVEAYDELLDLGYEAKALTPETVIGYLKVKPMYEKAESVVKEFKEDLSDKDYDSLISEYVKVASALPKLSEKEVIIHAAKNLGLEVEYVEDDAIVNALNKKVPTTREIEANKRKRAIIETFNGEVEYE